MQKIREREPVNVHEPVARAPWLGLGLITLGVGLAANSLLGPFVFDVIHYPLSETLMNQTIGLEAFSLALVAPLSVAAGILALRGHRAAPLLGIGPAAYTVYMFLQYVVGPEYAYYPGILPLHLALFVLGGVIAVRAWNAVEPSRLPFTPRRSERRWAAVMFFLAGFLVSRYVPMLADALRGEGLQAEFRENVTMFWSIVLLDVGVVLPSTLAVGIGLLARTAWRRKATYALMGWWALAPPSVAAMALAMLANDDPYANAGQAAVFVGGALAFAAFAVHLYRPLFERK